MSDETEDLFSQFYPGIAYFIAFIPSPTCNPDRLFEFLHFENTEAEINFIKTRVKHESEEQEHSERLSKELFNVLKDNDNDAVRQFVKLSSQFCYAKELNEMIYDWSEEEKTAVFGMRHLVPDNMNCKFLYPCRLVIVNDSDFGEIWEKASNNLKRDGLKFFCETISGDADGKVPVPLSDQAPSEIMDIINKINYAMANFDNPQILCNGLAYVKPKLAEYTFVQMMDTETYLLKLMGS